MVKGGKWRKETNTAPGKRRAAGSDSEGTKRVGRLGEETELKVERKSSNKVCAWNFCQGRFVQQISLPLVW